MDDSKVFMFPDGRNSSIDPALLVALNQNGGFGGGAGWMWPMFMWMMFPWLFGGMNGNGFGGWGNNGAVASLAGTGFLSNQITDNQSTDTLLQAINGNANAASQLAQLTHSNVNQVESALNDMRVSLATIGGNLGLTGQQVISQILSGNAALSQQLCECCCENRLATANQTAALQSSIAAHDANVRLQLAQNEAADQLSVCQQTNQLGSQADRNTNSILGAISAQNAMLEQRFCEIKEREMQDKINTQSDIITQLRGQISNDNQTLQFNRAMNALDNKIDAIAAKQPNTVPVQWPNLVAANATPYVGGYGWNNGYFGNGFGNNIVF